MSSTSALTVKNLAAYLPGGTYVSFTVRPSAVALSSYRTAATFLLMHQNSAAQHMLLSQVHMQLVRQLQVSLVFITVCELEQVRRSSNVVHGMLEQRP
jgi:cytochrome b